MGPYRATDLVGQFVSVRELWASSILLEGLAVINPLLGLESILMNASRRAHQLKEWAVQEGFDRVLESGIAGR